MEGIILRISVEKVSDQHLDATEDLEVYLKSPAEVLALLNNNEIIHPLMTSPLLKYLKD